MSVGDAFRAGWRGDFTLHEQVGVLPPEETALLRAQRWMAEPARGERASVPLRAANKTQARLALEAGRAARLERDFEALRQCAAAATDHAEGALLEAWMQQASGRFDEAVRASEEAARTDLDAPAKIDAVVVRARAHLEAGRMQDAMSLSRRAVRMARTEEFPQAQYAAGLCLARVRRASGATHLALRILAALARVVSPPWRNEVAWEQASCGVGEPQTSVGRWLRAAEAGDVAAFDAGFSILASANEAWRPFRTDLEAWRGLLDPEAPAPSGVEAYLCGESPAQPPRLRGLLSADPASTPGGALVLLWPDGASRRVARRGEALVRGRHPALEAPLPPGRTGLALSTLGLNGGVLSRERFFTCVYGFNYEHRVHRGTLKALVHRARMWLGDRGAITLDDAHVRLRLHGPLLIVDPDGERSLEQRMLRYLASAGARSARETAGALDVPLRSVQRTLSDLVEGGSLASKRAGRGVAYHVEDTVFSLPTLWR
ncbi:MAG: hypothetical protein AB8I08_19175 [Sandaracinaceae bacterium]